MGFAYDRFSAAPAAVTNRFVTSTNMVNASYTVANSGLMPTAGARKFTITHTTVTGTDTLGTITVTGTNLAGQTQSEVLVPVADGTRTSTKLYKTITTIVGAGWTINGGNDTVVMGCDATQALLDSSGGVLHSVIVNTTAAGTVTLADNKGTIAVLKASIAEGTYYYDVDISGALTVTQTAGSDITVVYSQPGTSF